jgi:hypothetical protein
MKNLQALSPLLTSLLLASMALAQAGGLPDAPTPQDSASEQRSAHAPTRHAPTTEAPSHQAADPAAQSTGNEIITQAAPFPRATRRPTPPPRGRAYPSAFAAPRPPALSPVGALIGFGAGAALGAAASGDQTARGRVAGALIGGTLCALIGGAIGRSFSLRSSHHYHDWDDAQKRKHHKPVPRPIEPEVNASATQAPAPAVGSL